MDQENQVEKPILHDFDKHEKTSLFSMKFITILMAVIILGTLTGFVLTKNKATEKLVGKTLSTSSVTKGTTIGSDDLKTFKDSAEGVIKEGGIEGEGQFHLERPGGVSQNVYMTSSIVDLSSVIGKKVKVWGQTQKAQKAGWLMDVGRIEVLD